MAIPTLSLATDEAVLAAQFRHAATSLGFFTIIDHGVPRAMVEDSFAWAEKLFALSAEQKAMIPLKANRGWQGLGTQQLDAGAKPDQKESYYCGPDYAADHPYVRAGFHGYGTNAWPTQALPGFREHMLAYTAAMRALSERLMRLMALSLGLPASYFDDSMAEPMLTLRLCFYPPHLDGASGDTFGAGAHTDWGAVTVLAQDSLGGLEVRGPDGGWMPVTPVADSFVINLGDMIPRWTNGLYRSNLHRVINANSVRQNRYSIPFFYSPDYMAQIAPVPGSLAPGAEPVMAPCTAGEHYQDMYRRSYGKAA